MRRNTALKRTAFPSRSHPMRSVGLKPVNKEKRKKKRLRYAAHLRSAYFRALRLEAFARDGFRCTGAVEIDFGGKQWTDRCHIEDTSRTGKGLHADHLSYARFGHELLEDLATKCRACHERRHALKGKRIYRP